MDLTEFQKKYAELQSEWTRKLEECAQKHKGKHTDEHTKENDAIQREYNKKYQELRAQCKDFETEAKKLGLI